MSVYERINHQMLTLILDIYISRVSCKRVQPLLNTAQCRLQKLNIPFQFTYTCN